MPGLTRAGGLTPITGLSASGGLTPFSGLTSTDSFSPSDISGLQLWLDANAQNSVLSDGAAHFTSANTQNLSIASNSTLNPGASDVWWAGWVYLDTKPAAQMTLLGKHDTTGNQRGYTIVWDNSTDRFRLALSNDGTAVDLLKADNFGSPSTATWYFIFAWYDATAQTANISVNNGTPNSMAHTGGIFANTAAFCIGGLNGFPTTYMNGRVDSVGMGVAPPGGFATTTASSIATALYNSGNGRVFADLTSAQKTAWGLMSWWDLDAETGTRYDKMGSNHLTASTTVLISNSPATLNGGFETAGSPFANWTSSAGGTSTVNDEGSVVHSGSHACRFDIDSSNSFAQIVQTILTAGNRYSYTVWARGSSGTPGIQIANSGAAYTTHTLTTSYAQYAGSFTAIDTTFKIARNLATSLSVYVDDVVLTDLGPVGIAGIAAGVATDGNFCGSFVASSSQSLSILAANQTGLDIAASDYTFAAWVNLNSFQTQSTIIGRGGTSNAAKGYWIYVHTTGAIRLVLSDGVLATTYTSTGTISLGSWAFVVITLNRAGNMTFTINNVAAGSNDITAYNADLTVSAVFRLAATSSGTGYIDGRIDDVGVWSRALTSAEATSLFNTGMGLKYAGLTGTLLTNLVSYWDLDNKVGITADSAGTNTLTNNGSTGFGQGVAYYTGVAAKWLDQSGLANHALQMTQSKRPSFVSNLINGKPALLFDGIDDLMFINAIATALSGTNKPFSFYVVINLISTTTGQPIGAARVGGTTLEALTYLTSTWRTDRRDDSGTILSIVSGATDTTAHIMSVTFDGTNGKMFQDSTQLGSTTNLSVGAMTLDTFTIGGRSANGTEDRQANLYMMEGIVYNAALTSVQDTQVKTYLKAKWSTP